MGDDTGMGLRLQAVEDKLLDLESGNNSRADVIKQTLAKLTDGLNTENVSREIMVERKTKDFKTLESALTLDINLERQQRKGAEEHIHKMLDAKCAQLVAELSVSASGGGGAKATESKVDEDRIARALEEEKRQRTQADDKIIQRINKEVKDLYDLIDTERKTREEGTRTLVSMMEKFSKRMVDDISQERREREQTEETICRLLEQATNRFEGR